MHMLYQLPPDQIKAIVAKSVPPSLMCAEKKKTDNIKMKQERRFKKILGLLRAKEKLSARQIAHTLKIGVTTANTDIDELVRDGYVVVDDAISAGFTVYRIAK